MAVLGLVTTHITEYQSTVPQGAETATTLLDPTAPLYNVWIYAQFYRHHPVYPGGAQKKCKVRYPIFTCQPARFILPFGAHLIALILMTTVRPSARDHKFIRRCTVCCPWCNFEGPLTMRVTQNTWSDVAWDLPVIDAYRLWAYVTLEFRSSIEAIQLVYSFSRSVAKVVGQHIMHYPVPVGRRVRFVSPSHVSNKLCRKARGKSSIYKSGGQTRDAHSRLTEIPLLSYPRRRRTENGNLVPSWRKRKIPTPES